MSAYRLRLLSMALIVAIYSLVATQSNLIRYQEFFPFFNWSLFSYSSSVRYDSTFAITSLDGDVLDKTVLINQLHDEFPHLRRNIKFNKSIWHLAEAVQNEREQDEVRLRAFIEDRYFHNIQTIGYDLVIIRYNPISRYRDRSHVEIVSVLRNYRYEKSK